jgi:hypothetical protein
MCVFPHRAFHMVAVDKDTGKPEQIVDAKAGEVAACDDCMRLIEAEDFAALQARFTANKGGKDSVLVAALHRSLVTARIGKTVRIGYAAEIPDDAKEQQRQANQR